MSHTPGPWRKWVDQTGTEHRICAMDGDFVCNLDAWNREANARLIAAAPELLEALKVAMVVLDENGFPRAAKAISEVIAKAEGGA